jgi:hypothetical protein
VAVVAVLLLGALPAILFFRSSGTDPVFANLDGLSLPAWAAAQHPDEATGSRYCVKTCRLRERDWHSTKSAQETDAAFETALTKAGWVRWRTSGCPKLGTGTYTCWQRDQFVLDLWTRDAVCGLVTPASAAPPSSAPPALDPVPSAGASGPPPTCAGALVTAKATDRINTNWHH